MRVLKVRTESGELVVDLDSRRRLAMLSITKTPAKRYRVTRHTNGTLLLTPMASITQSELEELANGIPS